MLVLTLAQRNEVDSWLAAISTSAKITWLRVVHGQNSEEYWWQLCHIIRQISILVFVHLAT